MPPANVGTAYVDVRANVGRVGSDVRRELVRQLRGAGDEAGREFGEGFERRFQRLQSRLASLSQRMGRNSGTRFADGFDSVTRGRLSSVLDRLTRDAPLIARRHGTEAGGAFGDGFGRGINLDVGPFNVHFASLTRLVATLTPVAVLAGQALAGLVAQASVLVSALASAASSSALFIPLLTALGTGVLTAVVGFQGFGDAVKDGGDALEKVSPNAREAAVAIRSLSYRWGELTEIVQNRLFDGVGDSIRELGSVLMPTLRRQLAGTADALNEFFNEFLQAAASGRNIADLNTALASQNSILGSLLGAVNPLISAFRDLFIPMLPLAQRLAEAIRGGAENLAAFSAAGRASGATADFFERAYDNARLLLTGLRDLTAGLINFFSAGREEGNSMLQTFADLTARFREFSGSVEGQQSFNEFFEFGAVVMAQLASTLRSLINLFGPILGVVADLLAAFAPLLPIVERLAAVIGDNLALALGPLVQLGEQVTAVFVGALGSALPAIAAAFNGLAQTVGQLIQALSPLVTQLIAALLPAILQILPPVFGLVSMIGQALIPVVQALVPVLVGLVEIFVAELVPVIKDVITVLMDVVAAVAPLAVQLATSLATALTLVAQLFAFLLPAIVPVVQIVGSALVIALTVATTAITTLISWISSAIRWLTQWGPRILDVGGLLRGSLSAGLRAASAAVSALVGWVRSAINWLGSWLGPISNVASFLRGQLSGALSAVSGAISAVIGAVRSVIGWFSDWRGALGDLGNAFGPIRGAISGFLGLVGSIGSAVSGAIGWIRDLIDAINSIPSLPSLGAGIPGFSFPGLAAGGVVTGPVTRRLGEGGMAEAVIPLERPLSLVDPSVRAMAALLRGETGGLAAGGIVGGRAVTVAPGAIQVVTPARDPEVVAEAVMDRLVALSV